MPSLNINRNLFRFQFLLSRKTSNIMECVIKFPRHRKRVFSPGEEVEVEIELLVRDAMSVDEIFMKVVGSAKCHFHKDQKKYHGQVNYIDSKVSLLNLSNLAVGLHQFKGRFTLPATIPSSFNCLKGFWKRADCSIIYKVEVHVKSLWRSDLKFEKSFTVVKHRDLNEFSPVLHVPLMQEILKNFTFDFSSKELYLSASIPQRAYVPHQMIEVTINVDNMTRTRIRCVRVSLVRILTLTSLKPTAEMIRIEIVEALEYCDEVLPKNHRVFNKSIKIPGIEPNIANCEIIQSSYVLKVKAKASGLHRGAAVILPILIGTIPLREQGLDVRSFSYDSFETETF